MGTARFDFDSDRFKEELGKARSYDYGDPPPSDYWAAQAEAMAPLPGRDDMDMSTHNNALRTFYMEQQIDKGLDDKKFGTHAMTEIMDNAEAYFLDKAYDSDGQLKEGIDSSFGFDLRRTGLDDNMDVRSPEYWDQLATNPINWESYEEDLSFIAQAKVLAEKHPEIYGDWDQDPGEDFNFNWDRFGEENKEASINLIRHAQQGAIGDIVKDNKDLSKRRWEGRYDADKIYMAGDDLYIDGERQETLSEMYAQGKGKIADAKDMYTWQADNIVGPVTKVVKPASLNINNIQKVEVKRPANIPASWGAV